jgi:hypothetical protein
MSTDSRKTVETPAPVSEAQTGWDPFTVWRERVHEPRSRRAAHPANDAIVPLAVLLPIKQRA